jgi:hypothetical protein
VSNVLHRDEGRRRRRRVPSRTFVFVSASEPLAAAEAAWSAPTAIDLCVVAPSPEARGTAAFACAGRAVRIAEEPLLGPPELGESEADLASRRSDALRAVYALDTRCALVVWEAGSPAGADPVVLDEEWLLRTADEIDRHLPFP